MYKYVAFSIEHDFGKKPKKGMKKVTKEIVLTGKVNDPEDVTEVKAFADLTRFYKIKNSNGTVTYIQSYKVDGFMFKPI
ncbi:MAG: hypothetical protein J6U54_05380 [Clostridiales bacterium]|nr:hypothetical protein [Clostridiales bacterium]